MADVKLQEGNSLQFLGYMFSTNMKLSDYMKSVTRFATNNGCSPCRSKLIFSTVSALRIYKSIQIDCALNMMSKTIERHTTDISKIALDIYIYMKKLMIRVELYHVTVV